MSFRLLACSFLLAAGCAGKAAYLVSPALRTAADPRVAVLPFDNQSTDIGAPDVMRKLAEEGFAKRGYQPLPAEEVDAKLASLGVSEGGQLPGVKPEALGQALGVDLLVYGDVEDFTFQNLGYLIRKAVVLRVKVVSAGTSETLYEGSGSGKDIKVFFNSDQAKAAFVEQLAVKLVQNILKTPLKKEAETAADKALGSLPRR
ncbi:MAG: hypothetical protein A2081_02210 [Elusimicrobia bacterium GWC2_61_19]|nr:MAG: hypothetical protein A2081_02210 [Elusimicrobia bacterium GWC2_61_19]